MLHHFDNKVFGWYADFDGCAYYRILKPFEALSDNLLTHDSWGTSAHRLLPPDWRDNDVIVGQRICNGTGDGSGPADLWVGEICRSADILSVYELDDDLFNVPEDNPAHEFFGQRETQQNLRVCIAASDLVTVSTEPLRQQLLKFNPNVKVLPNFIDQDVLDIDRPDNGNKVVIGWCGSNTHKADFATMSEQLAMLMAMNRQVHFTTIGANYSHGLPADRVQALGWIGSTRRIYKHVAKFDIGIAPLLPNKFNESKSYIKALEYAALGIPVVASNVGPYKEFVQHGKTGFLVDRPGQWTEYLGILLNDPGLRAEMGLNARLQANDYTYQGNVHRWADAYRVRL